MPDIKETVRQYFTQTMHLGPEAAERLLLKAGDVLARDLEALESCIQEGGQEALAGRVHRLKGDLANIGLLDLAGATHALGSPVLPISRAELTSGVGALRKALAPLLQHG